MKWNGCSQKGFSLIELMVAVAIAAFLAVVAVPSFNSVIEDYRTTTVTNAWADALRYSRTEALARNRRVTFCPTTNQSSCGGNWSNGWLAFDTSSNGASSANSTLRTWEAPQTSVTIQVSQQGGGAAVNSVVFNGRGWLVGNPIDMTAASNSCTGQGRRQISVSLTGRVNVTRGEC